MESNKPDRSIATPQRLITNEIEQLDIILNILNDNEQRPHKLDDIFNDSYFRENKSYILPKDLILAVEKLCLDKYVDKINEDWRNETEKSQNVPIPDYYRITYSGRLFLNNTWKIYRRRPNKEGQIISKWSNAWTITKTIMNVAITLMVVIITYWGVKVTDKSNRLEEDLKTKEKTEQVLREKIDSLVKMTNDTTRLRKR